MKGPGALGPTKPPRMSGAGGPGPHLPPRMSGAGGPRPHLPPRVRRLCSQVHARKKNFMLQWLLSDSGKEGIQPLALSIVPASPNISSVLTEQPSLQSPNAPKASVNGVNQHYHSIMLCSPIFKDIS